MTTSEIMDDELVRAPNIFILGTAKTGTTLLFYSIKKYAEENYGKYEGMFEPKTESDIIVKNQVVVKMLLERYQACESKDFIDSFEKKILIVRDPRDTIISRMLYQVRDKFDKNSRPQMEEIRELIRRKEKNPSSINVTDIFEEIGRIMNFKFSWETAIATAKSAIDDDSLKDFFLIKYEDIVDGKWTGLSDYLGFQVMAAKTDDVRTGHQRVKRTGAYGDWKKWFTKNDVQIFKPLLETSLKKGGYLADWELEKNPIIDRSLGSDYIFKLFEQKTQKHSTNNEIQKLEEQLKNLTQKVNLLNEKVEELLIAQQIQANKIELINEEIEQLSIYKELYEDLPMSTKYGFLQKVFRLFDRFKFNTRVNESYLLNKMVIDPQYYITTHPELVKELNSQPKKALIHWLKKGINEGLSSSSTFHVKYYLEKNQDLRKRFGNKYQLATQHWIKYGINEGRQSSPEFDVKTYLDRYPDLKLMFGQNYLQIIGHWLDHGRREGRSANPEIRNT